MGYRRVPFAVGEWYHCFTRGIDKRTTFGSEDDCRRFLELLYLANDNKPVDRSNFSHRNHAEILKRPRGMPLVAIGGYCLMSNHYHLLLHEIVEGGISQFMQKLGTGYSMYFNAKHDRIGNVFVKPFRSKHVDSDAYLHRVAQYVHLNAAELYEPAWKSGHVANAELLERQLMTYPFSSLPDYFGTGRLERSILDPRAFMVIKDKLPKLSSVLADAREYYRETESSY